MRVVSVRLTEEEYDTLTKACQAEEARSLSEFTRTVMKENLALRRANASLIEREKELLRERMEDLYRALRAATERIAEMLGHSENRERS